jgi:hypothetical protein
MCTLEQRFSMHKHIVEVTCHGVAAIAVSGGGRTMTRQIIPIEVFEPAAPDSEGPQLNEGLWRAWIEKNERAENLRFVRRVKVTVLLAVLLGALALARVLG